MKKFNIKSILISVLIISSQIIFTNCTYADDIADSNKNNSLKLIWSDEFDGGTINTNNWTYDIGKGSSGWGNNELQYYTNRNDNSRIENGNLIIEAKKENFGDSQYTSARLKSKGLQEFTYGRIEARIKLPSDQGIWPAFWMLGSSFNGDEDWPYCGEIDIMENVSKQKDIYGSIHWNNNGPNTFGSKLSIENVEDYHVYAIEWTPSYIKWYVDDVLYNTAIIGPVSLNNSSYYIPNDTIKNNEAFHKPFFLLLNVAVGGNWPKSPDNTTKFPAKMYVDYVRVYESN